MQKAWLGVPETPSKASYRLIHHVLQFKTLYTTQGAPLQAWGLEALSLRLRNPKSCNPSVEVRHPEMPTPAMQPEIPKTAVKPAKTLKT